MKNSKLLTFEAAVTTTVVLVVQLKPECPTTLTASAAYALFLTCLKVRFSNSCQKYFGPINNGMLHSYIDKKLWKKSILFCSCSSDVYKIVLCLDSYKRNVLQRARM